MAQISGFSLVCTGKSITLIPTIKTTKQKLNIYKNHHFSSTHQSAEFTVQPTYLKSKERQACEHLLT